ncbi:MAG TPA: hypothetical protein VFE84_06450, partial [Patescibacteria group bacterium]|nr:hypothetical protein [Patescibacteria group bacterium]
MNGYRHVLSASMLLIVVGLVASTGPRAQDAPPPSNPQNEARQFQQQGLAAYQRKDYLAFVENMQKAVALLPDHPGMIYRLAVASALVGNKDDSLAQLRRLVSMSIVEDISGDPDFDSLKDSPEFQRIVEAMKGLKTRVGTSVLAFRLAEKDLIPEGVTHDPVTGDFFVGSVHNRKILRVSKRGKAQDFTSEKQDGLWAVLGMKVDAQRRALWACSSAVPQMKDAQPDELGRATLFKFDLNTGALVKKYPLGNGDAGHNCNDLVVSAQGDVFVSDAESSEVLKLAQGADGFAALVPAGQLRSPQG